MMRVIFPILMLVALVIAGCAGHGGSVVPTSTPTLAPAQEATTVPLSTTASTQVVLGGVSSGGVTVINSANVTLPAANNASTATITLTATAPSGVPAPSARNVPVEGSGTLGVPSTALAYIGVQVNPTTTLSQVPTFAFTFPSAVSGNCSIVFYDPSNPAQGWQGLAGPDACGSSVVISAIKPLNRAPITLNAGTAYTFALVTTASGITPPAYCTTEGVAPSKGLTLNITDSSGLVDAQKNAAVLLVYVQQQPTSAPSPYPNGSWMDSSGNFAASGAVPHPLPAACYSSTLGSGAVNNPLVVPIGHSGRIYLVYATPAPDGQIPNPFSGLTPGQQPKNSMQVLFDKAEFGVFNPAETGQYNLNSADIDITQVDFVGLPLEMQVLQSTSATPLPAVPPTSCAQPAPKATPFAGAAPGLGTVFGYTQCGYLGVFQTLTSDPTFGTTYGKLVTSQAWAAGANVGPFRALSVAGAITVGNSPFNYNAFGDPSLPLPDECTDSLAWRAYGIIGCLLDTYAKNPQFYDTQKISGGGSDYDHFCIGADNTTTFVFEATDIGTATSCAGATPKPTSAAYLPVNPFSIPAVLFTNPSIAEPNPGGYPQNGSTPNPQNCNPSTVGQVFNASMGLPYVDQKPSESGVPYPLPAPTAPALVFRTADAFTLWKGIILELNYGSAFKNGDHPLETTPPSFVAGVFSSKISNFYARTAHEYADGQYAYALGYDDGFKWNSAANLVAPGTLNLRVNPMPTAPAASPAGSAPTVTCGAFTAGVGNWYLP